MITRNQAKLIRKLKSRKHRDERLAFLVEGVRLTEDLLASGLEVELAVTAPSLGETERGRRLRAEIAARGLPQAEASDRELTELAGTESPQGVLVVARRPARRLAEFEPGRSARVLVFDGVGDPGNLGTLLRAADALGVGWAVILPGTVDPWNPKAARASAGSLFRLPISQEPWPEVATWLRRHSFAIFCADPDGEPVPRSGTAAVERFALVLGSEPAGITETVRGDCDRRVAVALPKRVDSLNVAIAGALLLDRLLGGARPDGG